MEKKSIKRVWILNHHAQGNRDRHDALANELVKLGVEVLIVASSYNHSQHKYKHSDRCVIEKRNKSLTYAWLRTVPTYKTNGLSRVLNMLSYLHLIVNYSKDWWTDLGKPDVVIGSSVHPFAWEAAYWIAKKTGADFYAEVRDLWPLSLIEVQKINSKHPIVNFFGILEKRAYRRAKKIITTMPYAYKYISNTLGFPNDKVHWIPNGIDTINIDNILNNSNISLPSDLDNYLEKNWCAVYTGSLVESECVDYILDAAKILQNRGNNHIKFAIVGDGHLKKQLVEIAEKQNLENVKFFDRISKDQVALAVNRSKVCLAAVRNFSLYKYGLSMNKLSDYLYSGNPTIFSCDVQNVVSLSGGGITLPFGNTELYADSIETVFNMSEEQKRVMVSRAKETIRQHYDTNTLAKSYLSIFEDNR